MVQQYKVFWSIPNAGPSVSTFHAQASSETSAAALATRLRAFFNSVAAFLPNDVSLSFDSEVTTIDTATGVLTGTQAVPAPAGVTGTDSAAWAGGAGARIVWNTGAIVAGRRVRGSTFIVPIRASAFDTAGRVSAGTISNFATAIGTLLAGLTSDSAELVVWSRPATGRPGTVHTVAGGAVSPVAASLRGRKY